MSKLIVPPFAEPDSSGRVLRITPESAGWKHVGFEAFVLEKGRTLRWELENGREMCAVILTGIANVAAGGERFERIGRRLSVFDGTPPYAVYAPAGTAVEIEAATRVELALCFAPGQGSYPVRLITPEQVGVELRGYGSMERTIHNILPESEPADSLLVVEVLTPPGHWSSYPPHKHDTERLPHESLLEETYYHRIRPEHGFAIQRVYTDDRSLDETLTVRNGEAVLVPKGYHPVSAPPGYAVYYLNVMAGPVRTWRFHNDPEHEWLFAPAPDDKKKEEADR